MAAKTHRSFTLRVDIDFYLELAEMAQAEGIPLNQLANRLLRLGKGKHIDLSDALRAMLLDKITETV